MSNSELIKKIKLAMKDEAEGIKFYKGLLNDIYKTRESSFEQRDIADDLNSILTDEKEHLAILNDLLEDLR